MNKIVMTSLDEDIFHEKLDSGLNVYIYKKEGFIKKGAYFITKYGSAINDFKPIGEDKIVSFPKGIAHFLEHKLFESEDNEKVFDKFRKYGANVNAYTDHFITNYYFSTNDNFYECLDELITFVRTPYFTDQNVEKEKGIINQEINMTNDDIERFIFEEMFSLALVENPNKYKTIGDKQNVSKITKEDLYRCYKTFYHPSNMFLVIYGDVDIDETINFLKKKEKENTFLKGEEIIRKEFKEPSMVMKEYKKIIRNVITFKIGICYKFIVGKKDKLKKFKMNLFIRLLLDLKFGNGVPFEKDLIKDGITKNGVSWTYSYFDDVILLFFEADVINKDEFIKRVHERLIDNNFDKNLFELNRKALLTQVVRTFDSPISVGNMIYNDVIKYGKVINDKYEIYKNYSYDEFLSYFDKLNFDNKSILYVTNKEE